METRFIKDGFIDVVQSEAEDIIKVAQKSRERNA